MKQILLILLINGCCRAAISQTVITSASALWPGDVLSFQEADTSANESPAGAGQAWDFSDAVNYGLPYAHYIVTPDQTGWGSSFPLASSAIDDSNGNYTFLQNTDSTMEITGLVLGDQLFTYSDNEIQFKYPFTYNDAFTDTFRGTSFYNGVTVQRFGITRFHCDGNGTLILPSGVISSTLRISMGRLVVDTAFYGNIEVVSITADTSYFWMIASNKNRLMNIHYNTITANSATSYRKDVQYFVPFTSAEEAPSPFAHLDVFPNPTDDVATIRFTVREMVQGKISLMNGSGRELNILKSGVLLPGTYSLTADLSAEGPGLYLVRFEVEGRKEGVMRLLKSR